MDVKGAPPSYDEHTGSAAYGQVPPHMQGQTPYPAGAVPYPAGQVQQTPYFQPLPTQPGQYSQPPQQQQYVYQPPPPTVVHVHSDPHMHPHTTTTTIVVKQDVNHCLHCCISIFFPPWIFIWIFLCLTN